MIPTSKEVKMKFDGIQLTMSAQIQKKLTQTDIVDLLIDCWAMFGKEFLSKRKLEVIKHGK